MTTARAPAGPVLLIEPPTNPATARFGLPAVACYPPLSSARIAGQMPEEDVRIVDLRLPGEVRRLRALVRQTPPVLAGISLTFTSNGDEALAVAELIRRESPGTVIVLGGTAASEDAAAFFDAPVDFLAMRQGDVALPELVRAVRREGAAPPAPAGFRHRAGDRWEAGEPARHVPLDAVRPAAWNLLPARAWRRYFQGFRTTGMGQTSEGCPFDCNFCSVWKTHGRRVDVASLENVQHDFESLPPHVRAFFFADDIWMLASEEQKRRLHDPLLEWMASDYLRRRPSLRLTVETRTDLFLREDARFEEWVRRGGLRRVLFGVEAVSDEQLKAFSKRNTVDHNSAAIRRAAELGAYVTAQLVIHCDADVDYFDEIVRFLEAHRPYIHTANFTIATPLPGTDLYEDVLRSQPELADRARLRHPAFGLFTALMPTRLPLPEFYEQVARVYRAANQVSFSWTGARDVARLAVQTPWLLREISRMPLVLRRLVDPATFLDIHRGVVLDAPAPAGTTPQRAATSAGAA